MNGVWVVELIRGGALDERRLFADEAEAVRYAEGLVKLVWFNAGLRRVGRHRWSSRAEATTLEVRYVRNLADLL